MTAVKFCSVNATFTLNSATQISASVPAAATTGPISVITAGVLATSTSTFTVNPQSDNPPILSITRVGNDLILTWLGPTANFEQQQNPDLSPANWMRYTGTITDNGTNRTATLINATGNRFFRFHAPTP